MFGGNEFSALNPGFSDSKFSEFRPPNQIFSNLAEAISRTPKWIEQEALVLWSDRVKLSRKLFFGRYGLLARSRFN